MNQGLKLKLEQLKRLRDIIRSRPRSKLEPERLNACFLIGRHDRGGITMLYDAIQNACTWSEGFQVIHACAAAFAAEASYQPKFFVKVLHHVTNWNPVLRSKVSKEKRKPSKKRKHYRYLLALDFEATCDQFNKPHPQEIIEFPVIPLDLKTGEMLPKARWFHHYVKPTVHPQLTTFCTMLTGIKQSRVEAAEPFRKVYSAFVTWLDKGGYTHENSLFCTCGEWDLATMWPLQVKIAGLPPLPIMNSWINVKVAFRAVTGQKNSGGMMRMLKSLSIKPVGRHHSGIDDARNLVSICQYALKKNYNFVPSNRSRGARSSKAAKKSLQQKSNEPLEPQSKKLVKSSLIPGDPDVQDVSSSEFCWFKLEPSNSTSKFRSAVLTSLTQGAHSSLNKSIVDLLCEAILLDPCPYIRQNVAYMIGRLVHQETPKAHTLKIVSSLVDSLRKEKEFSTIRACAAQSLARISYVTPIPYRTLYGKKSIAKMMDEDENYYVRQFLWDIFRDKSDLPRRLSSGV